MRQKSTLTKIQAEDGNDATNRKNNHLTKGRGGTNREENHSVM